MQQISLASVIEYLQATIIGSTDQIRQAQKQLSLIANNPQFVDSLFSIAKDLSLPYNVRKSTIVYLISFSKNNQALLKNHEMLIETGYLIFTKLQQHQIQPKLRRYLIVVLCNLSPHDKTNKLKYLIYTQCINLLSGLHQHALIDDMKQIIHIGLAFEAALSVSVHYTKQLGQFIRKSIISYAGIAMKVFEACQLTGQRQRLMHILPIMRLFSRGTKLYLRKIAYSDLQTVKLLFQPTLCTLLSQIWHFNLLPSANLLHNSILFYSRNQDHRLVQAYHQIKCDYVQSLSLMYKTILQYFKKPEILVTHLLISDGKIVQIFMNCMVNVGNVIKYEQIQSNVMIRFVEEIMNFMIILLRAGHHLQIFIKNRQQFLKCCILKILTPNPSLEYQTLIDDPQQFIAHSLQIIDMDPTQYLKTRNKYNNQIIQQQQQLQSQQTTIKTVAATLLSQYCKSVDGMMKELLAYVGVRIREGNEGGYRGRGMCVVVLGVLRDQVVDGEGLVGDVVGLLVEAIGGVEELQQDSSSAQDAQGKAIYYCLVLLVLQKYLSRCRRLPALPSLPPTLHSLLSTPAPSALKILSYDTLTLLAHHNPPQCLSFLHLLNQHLHQPYPQNLSKQLQSLYNLYKYQDQSIINNRQLIDGTIDGLKTVIMREIDKGQYCDGDILDKCWNVLDDLCQNQSMVGDQGIRGAIDGVLSAVSQAIFNQQQQQHDVIELGQDRLLGCVSLLIEKTEDVNKMEMEVLGSVKGMFYGSGCVFGNGIFESVMMGMRYGAGHGNKNEKFGELVGIYFDMAVSCLSLQSQKQSIDYLDKNQQFQNLQLQQIKSILILQTIAVSHTHCIPPTKWSVLTSLLAPYLRISTRTPLQHNILSLLCLISIQQQQQPNMCPPTNQQNISLNLNLNLILEYISVNNRYIVKNNTHSCKIMIVCLCEMMVTIAKRGEMEAMVGVVRGVLGLTKRGDKDSRNQQEQFEGQGSEEESSDRDEKYNKLLQYLNHRLMTVNQTEYFKTKLKQVKQSNPEMIGKMLGMLSPEEVDALQGVVSTVNVNNQSRQVYKIKR